jgi:hypothetical protein
MIGRFPIKAKVRDWPDDLTVNFDYYKVGAPKQRPRRGRWLGSGHAGKEFSPTRWKEFNERLDALAVENEGLPSDLAKNHDHYLHGHPRS